MAAPIVYRSDDPDAPVIMGSNPKSVQDVLRGCLVTGYGSKPGAGWTLEYVDESANAMAFKNAGTGGFLKISKKASTPAQGVHIQGFESMQSIDDGLFPFSTTLQMIWYYFGNEINCTRPWIVIADDKAFYLFIFTKSRGWPITVPDNSSMFFGDIVNLRPDSSPGCCLIPAHGSHSSYGGIYSLSREDEGAGGGLYSPRNASGVPGSVAQRLVKGGGPGHIVYPGTAGPVYSAGDQILLSRPYINDGNAYTMRGWLPGFYTPCHNLAFPFLSQIQSDGMNFLSFNCFVGIVICNFFISLDDWRT